MRIGFVVAVFLALFAAPFVSANTDCPLPGQRRAVASDAVVKNNTIALGTCYDPQNAVGINQGAEEAKQYLKSIFRPVTSCTPADEQINRVNSAFAVCAAKFLKTFNEQYGGAVVTRAWNSNQCETEMCKRGPPGVGNVGCGGFAKIAVSGGIVDSNHTRSVALDVTAGNKQETMIAFANKNPQFGVCFPLASWDKVHMVLAGIGGGERCPAPNKPCDGVNFNPNDIRQPTAEDIRNVQQQHQPNAGPQRLAEAIRNYASPAPAPTSQPLNSSTQSNISSVFAMPQATSTLLVASTGTSTGTGQTTTQASSSIDILTSISLGASDIATGTSIVTPTVTINAGDVVSLTPGSSQNLQYVSPQAYTLNPNFPASQTFTSDPYAPGSIVPETLSGIEALIRDIRVRVDAIANYLRPFGAVHHAQIPY